jgi:hypothetical protein
MTFPGGFLPIDDRTRDPAWYTGIPLPMIPPHRLTSPRLRRALVSDIVAGKQYTMEK